VIAGAGWLLRVSFVMLGSRFDVAGGDQLYYSAQAIANVDGHWYRQPFATALPAAEHPPLTALFLTPITWVVRSTDHILLAQRLAMTVVGALGVAAVGVLARDVARRSAWREGADRVGSIAAAIAAVYANVWVNDGLLMSESLAFLLVTLVAIGVGRLWSGETKSTTRTSIATGVAVGLCALTRPELMVLVIVIPAVWVLVRRKIGFRDGVTVALVGLVVIAPWVAWNLGRFDEPVFLGTNDGVTMAGGNCDRTWFDDVGSWDLACALAVPVPVGSDASVASSRQREAGLRYVTAHLDRLPVVVAARLVRVSSLGFFGSSFDAAAVEGRPIAISWLGVAQYWVLVGFALIGFRYLPRFDRWMFLVPIVLVLGVAAIANAYVRLRIPAEMGLVVTAAIGIETMIRRRTPDPVGVGVSESG